MHYYLYQFGSNPWSLFICTFSLLLLWGAYRALEWSWLRPRRLNQALRKQGLCGTVYRPIVGDLKENARLNKEAYSKPMQLSHDITARVAPLLHNSLKEYGKKSFTWFGTYPRVTITDPKLVQEILSNKFGHFAKLGMPRLGQLLVGGVVTYEGEKWAKHRRILNPGFHVGKLKRLLPTFSTCCDELVERWVHSVGPDGSFEMDVWPEIQNLTGDVISRAAFGNSYEEVKRIFQHQSEQAERIAKALSTSYNPVHLYLPTENNKRLKKNTREVRALIMGIIAKKEEAIKNGKTTQDNLLSALLESNIREIGENKKLNSNVGMTAEEVIEECRLFYFAGQETTSLLVTWTMVVLSMHPDWQDKAREEVFQHFGIGRMKPDFDGLSQLKIVTMVLYEVLRLYPPVVMINRRTYKTMQLGDLTLPPGVVLGMPILFIHHDPEIWGPNANEFKPTRFAEGISKATKYGQLAFFPFGWGPRICIGQNFALLEAKMALSMILQHFRFELSENYQHAPYNNAFTIHPQHGALLKLYRI
ncbi:Cytochrome P450 [Rhynchospora pubera]|uniref:Cytochrome P450 n=1 Tax=Rhynchospora pubera TaxID=906938 RepID=A0AAV8DYQ3_9POAL|nr:Cytochrome P450 [Rhynchospora pubera]